MIDFDDSIFCRCLFLLIKRTQIRVGVILKTGRNDGY